MLKRIPSVLLGLAVFMTSCQAGRIPDATDTTALSTATVSSSTATPGSTTEPIQTSLPAISGTLPHCFVASTEVSAFTFMPDSVRILIKERAAVRLFNLETLETESFFQAPQDLIGAALSPDGEILAWSLADNSIQLIRTADGTLINTMKEHTLPVFKLRFSPTGDRMFSASMDTWVRIWDRNGKPLNAFQPTGADNLPNDIEGIGISPDGTMLGSIPFDGPTRVWNLADKREIVNLGETGGDVTSDIDFSPDGKFVAADPLGRLSLWRTSDWKKLWSGVSSMAFAFSPDGRFLAYSDVYDGYNVTLRSLPELLETHALEGHNAAIYELFFSPDGALLGSSGAGIRIWQVATGQLAYLGKNTCP